MVSPDDDEHGMYVYQYETPMTKSEAGEPARTVREATVIGPDAHVLPGGYINRKLTGSSKEQGNPSGPMTSLFMQISQYYT